MDTEAPEIAWLFAAFRTVPVMFPCAARTVIVHVTSPPNQVTPS